MYFPIGIWLNVYGQFGVQLFLYNQKAETNPNTNRIIYY